MKKNINYYLIIDGYNIINVWDNLKELVKEDLEDFWEKFIDDIIEFFEFMGYKIIIVFDVYNVKNFWEKVEKRKYIIIVYIREY